MPGPRAAERICGRSLEEFFEEITRFHGHPAPGLVLGGFMVDWALELVRARSGERVEADAIVESRHCLPDAVQIFTPCTVGNGWLKVLDWDKFALCLYDKHALIGCRVWVDLEKARAFPRISDWYLQRVSKQDLPLEQILDAIVSAGRSVLSCRPVRVTRLHGPVKKKAMAICPGCGEAYPLAQGGRCLACQGGGYCIPMDDMGLPE